MFAPPRRWGNLAPFPALPGSGVSGVTLSFCVIHRSSKNISSIAVQMKVQNHVPEPRGKNFFNDLPSVVAIILLAYSDTYFRLYPSCRPSDKYRNKYICHIKCELHVSH